MSKIIEKLLSDPRVVDVSDERSSGDGFWCYLGSGFCVEPGLHCIHEDSPTQCAKILRSVTACDCVDCRYDRGAAAELINVRWDRGAWYVSVWDAADKFMTDSQKITFPVDVDEFSIRQADELKAALVDEFGSVRIEVEVYAS